MTEKPVKQQKKGFWYYLTMTLYIILVSSLCALIIDMALSQLSNLK